MPWKRFELHASAKETWYLKIFVSILKSDVSVWEAANFYPPLLQGVSRKL